MHSRTDSSAYQQFIAEYYHIIALLAGVIFAFYNFSLNLYSRRDLELFPYLMSLNPFFSGIVIYWAIFHAKEALALKRRYGFYWDMSFSAYFEGYRKDTETAPIRNSTEDKKGIDTLFDMEEEDDLSTQLDRNNAYKVNWYTLYALSVRTFIMTFGQYVSFSISYTAYRADVNLSLILNLFWLDPFITAVIFYFAFGESVNKIHLLGMCLLAVCIVLMTVSPGTTVADAGVATGEPLSIWIPIVLVLTLILIYCFMNWTNRKYPPLTGMKSQQYIVDSFFMEGIILMIMTALFPQPYEPGQLLEVVILSVLAIAGLSACGESVAYGKAGPGQSLLELNALWLLVLEMIILHEFPTPMQYVAFFVGMAGGLIIALNP